MVFKKQQLAKLKACYAVSSVVIDGQLHYIFASDGPGSCIAVNADTLQTQTVWDAPGGTMSIVPLENTNGAFLATVGFLPVFAAKNCEIVRAQRINGAWNVTPWLRMPYLHRFDIVQSNGKRYLFCCILSGTDNETADWNSPGFIEAAQLDEAYTPPESFTRIAEDMPINHGYSIYKNNGTSKIFTACDNGVYEISLPGEGQSWRVTKLMNIHASDVFACDIDGDGIEELAVIEPFHGNRFTIYKNSNGVWRDVYSYAGEIDFAHAIWGGSLCGRRAFVCGCRALGKELFAVYCCDGQYVTKIIERGCGSSNVAVITSGGRDIILSANREMDEAARYEVFYEK